MKKDRNRFWFMVAVLCGLILISGISRWMAPHDIVPWRTDLAAARLEAANTKKPLLMYFTAEWCVACEQMKRTTWADARVEKALRDYVPVKIDIDRNPELAMQYAPEAIPTMVVVDGNGTTVKSISMALEPEEFMVWLATAPR